MIVVGRVSVDIIYRRRTLLCDALCVYRTCDCGPVRVYDAIIVIRRRRFPLGPASACLRVYY